MRTAATLRDGGNRRTGSMCGGRFRERGFARRAGDLPTHGPRRTRGVRRLVTAKDPPFFWGGGCEARCARRPDDLGEIAGNC
jgi:hypothetical protein